MMGCMYKLALAILLLPSLLLGVQKTKVTHHGVHVPYEPWLTGTFLSPTPINMEIGHPAIEPSVTFFYTYGNYDSNWKLQSNQSIVAINPLLDYQFAITERTGFEICTSFITSFSNGNTATRLSDTLLFFGYQALDDVKDSWIPDLRLFLEIVCPSGKHDKIDPTAPGIDFSGQGAYFFGPNISYQKLFYLPDSFFMLHLAIGYFFPTKPPVTNLSVYGGEMGTNGFIRPGQNLIAFISGEYSFSQRWAFVFDTEFNYQRKSSKFSGNPGPNLSKSDIGLPESVQISFAPALSYNFSDNTGLLAGSWFTLAGKNSTAFASGFFSFSHIF